VCRSDQPTAVLQKAIDFACGPQGGADCMPILQGGGCYSPDTAAAHCSWAANTYYQNNKARGATCDFGGAATVSTTDPSTTIPLLFASPDRLSSSSSSLSLYLQQPSRCSETLPVVLSTLDAGFSGCTFASSATRYTLLLLLLRY
jgi:hypothetical protein